MADVAQPAQFDGDDPLRLARRTAPDVIAKRRIGSIMPREKRDRGARPSLSSSQAASRKRDRDTEALRAIVRALAREAAREGFDQALAQQQGMLKDGG